MSESNKMPMKTSLPVAVAQQPTESVKLGPRVLMSGYMTKKTWGVGMWKQRWWQLKDDGILQYYKPEDPPQKLLGEIDIGKTCYEVKMGSETRMKFPKAVPSCCCFFFSVLKRVYFVYTPTPDEAKNWVSAISDISRVINIKFFAGLERRKAPEIPGGNAEFKVTRVKVKGGSPDCNGSCQSLSKIQYLPLEKRKLALASSKSLSTSVPGSLDQIGDEEEILPSELRGSSNERKTSLQSQDSLQSANKNKERNLPDIPNSHLQYNHRAHSMEDHSSPSSHRRPVPAPRKPKRTDAEVNEKQSELPGDKDRSKLKLAKVVSLDSSIASAKKMENRPLPPKPQLKKKNSIQLPCSPPSSPPPAPPNEYMPPPPASSPPHSRPKLSSPSKLKNSHKKGDKNSTHFPFPNPTGEPAPGPMASPLKSALEDGMELESSKKSQKFKIPPPPSH